MLNATRIVYFNRLFLLLTLKTMSKEFYCFNEDSNDVQSFYFKYWDQNFDHIDEDPPLIVGITTQEDRLMESTFNINLWQIAAQMKNIRYEYLMYQKENHCLLSVLYNNSDICLFEISQRKAEEILLPFSNFQYGIYYKINEFHVSSTFFIEGMSHDLWMFSFITLFLIFVGFLISTKLYCHYLKRTWVVSDVFIYQANFWCNQTVRSYLDKFLSWRVQLINGFMFNIVIMTAFSAKFVGLMSIRHFEQPFNNLEDFATLRSHTLCVSPNLIPMKYFLKNEDDFHAGLLPKWNGIINQPICAPTVEDFHGEICKHDNVAIVNAKHHYFWKFVDCPVYELSGFLKDAYGSLMLSKRSKQKEKINQAYLKMREVGIIDRMSKQYGIKKDPMRNYQDHYSDKYNVQDEGVMFDHVKLIVIGYFLFLLIPLMVLLIEIMVHRYMNRH